MRSAGELKLKAVIKGCIKNSASSGGSAERPGGVPCTLAFASHTLKCDPEDKELKCWKSRE